LSHFKNIEVILIGGIVGERKIALLNAAFVEACTDIKAPVINANTMKIKVLFIMLTKIFCFWGKIRNYCGFDNV
jgi:hypothetical protein